MYLFIVLFVGRFWCYVGKWIGSEDLIEGLKGGLGDVGYCVWF